jgi:membrane-associated phospholipid phosphatase
MRLPGLLPVLLLTLCPVMLSAQASLDDVGDDLRNAGHDVLRVWAAPFHADADDLPYIGLAGAAVLGSALLDRPVQEFIRAGPAARRVMAPFIAPSPLVKLGSLGNLTILSGVLYIAGVAADKRDLRDAGMGCLAGGWSNSIARHGVYALVSRTRPSATRDPFELDLPGGDWDHRSFFGGHGSNIMTCAAVWSERFDLGLGEPVLYVAATGIAFGRTVDGAHWTSDTVAGLIVGYAIGKLVADRQKQRILDGAAPASSFYLTWKLPL